MMQIFRSIQDFLGFNSKNNGVVIFPEESVETEETPEDEETKFEMTITDEIACAAESKLFEMTKFQTETLNDHKISMKALKQKFDELDATEVPIEG